MRGDEEDVKLRMLDGSELLERANGRDTVTIDDDDEGDVDGQMGDKNKDHPKKNVETEMRNLFFKDGKSRIDFVLAWSTEVPEEPTPKEKKRLEQGKEARRIFEENLVKEGLTLEYDQTGKDVHFVKVHSPFDVLKRYSDILKMRVPMKESITRQYISNRYGFDEEGGIADMVTGPSFGTRLWQKSLALFNKLMVPFHYDEEKLPEIHRHYTCPYSSSREYLFEVPKNKEDLFPIVTRSWITDYILRRKPFAVASDKDNSFEFGINKMIKDNFYCASFPLHEGHWKAGSAENPRKVLFDHWANWRNILKFQPLGHVRAYFGERIGLYFAWLGFYTAMLVPAAIVGIAVFIYGLVVMSTNKASQEICDSDNIIMCPLCDAKCPYWKLSDACSHARLSRIFDNGSTVFFAVFMSLWGTLFLEFWKRKESTIGYKWDLASFVEEEEPPRPEYLSKLENWHTMKINPVTGVKEPHLPFWRKRFPIFLCSYGTMLFLAAVAISSVVGVIAYRVSMLAALNLIPDQVGPSNNTAVEATTGFIYQNASLITTCTAALINLIIIIILNWVYGHLAFKLTDWECLRSQSDYDASITIKLFVLQFVNYFSSIFYIAFFKGQFVGRPGKYRKIFGGRQEECEAGGCLIELCLQLAIIMIGKQLIQNNIMEIFLPKLIRFIKRKMSKETREQKLARTSWQKDYLLDPAGSMSLFYEFLEMAIQFGFLTIFCAAFPLAPFFALLNNLIEIRLDATKLLTQLRRPVGDKAASIGIWFGVLYGLARLAILSNAFIIALTSEFIPRLVYSLRYSESGDLTGYVNFTMAYFKTKDFLPGFEPRDDSLGSVELCRYKDFRNPPWEDPNYRRSTEFWHVLTARLAFVCIFENVVVVITGLIAWLIPDVPKVLKEQIRREAYITNEIVLKMELKRAHGEDMLFDVVSSLGSFATLGTETDPITENDRYSPRRSEENLSTHQRKPKSEGAASAPNTYV